MNNYKKGILLAGGNGTRLQPITSVINKHLIPVYDKPMIYYSISMLMLAKVREICIVTNSKTKKLIENLFEDGRWLGMNIKYKIQKSADGIVGALNLCEDFIDKQNFVLALGDNFIYGSDLVNYFDKIQKSKYKTNIFSFEVKNPQDFGIINKNSKKLNIVEKPKKNIGNKAIVGLYFLPKNTFKISKKIKKSNRGEKEIANLLNNLCKSKNYQIYNLKRGMKWIDMGTIESLVQANQFIQLIEQTNYGKIACLEEIALKNQWIKRINHKINLKKNGNSCYSDYLKKL